MPTSLLSFFEPLGETCLLSWVVGFFYTFFLIWGNKCVHICHFITRCEDNRGEIEMGNFILSELWGGIRQEWTLGLVSS